MVSILSLKNSWNIKKWSFHTLRMFVFELMVASIPFSKQLPLTTFWFNWSWTLCLTFPVDGFNFRIQKLAKNWKMTIQVLRTFVFELKVASKSFYKNIPRAQFWFKWLRTFCLNFPENVLTSSLKNFKKTQKSSFLTHGIFAFELKVASKPFSKRIPPWPNFDWSSLEGLASLSQKMVSISSLKNLRTLVFELKVAPKQFSVKFLIPNFDLNRF